MFGDIHDTHEFNMLSVNEQVKRLRESLLKRQKEAEQPTLRDQFAMAALQGILAHSWRTNVTDEGFAGDAYRLADAMLAMRAAGGGD